MSDAIILHIQPESARLRMETVVDGIVQYKKISKDVLLNCIQGSMAREAMSSGILPENCFHFAQLDRGERDYCLRYPRYMPISATIRLCTAIFPCPGWSLGFMWIPGERYFIAVSAWWRISG